jgi:hypothetical protein
LSCVISFSLYGDAPYYCEGAIRNALLAPEVYPGWRCRFYVDSSVPERYVTALQKRGCEIVFVSKKLGPMYGRYWRFWVAADPSVERFIVRDVDSRLGPREKAAVDEWIKSGKNYHLMRDHSAHNRRVLGGMWGGRGGVLPEIESLVDAWGHYEHPGENDRFMSEVIYPLMAGDYLCHDGGGHFDDAIPFPIPECREWETHIGGRIHPESDVDFMAAFERLANRAKQLERERDALLRSASWRITAPLRKLIDVAGLRGSLRQRVTVRAKLSGRADF